MRRTVVVRLTVTLLGIVAVLLGLAHLLGLGESAAQTAARVPPSAFTAQPTHAAPATTSIGSALPSVGDVGPVGVVGHEIVESEGVDSDSFSDELEREDVLGNDITDAVATYKLDASGGVYEEHAPDTEVPRLASPTT